MGNYKNPHKCNFKSIRIMAAYKINNNIINVFSKNIPIKMHKINVTMFILEMPCQAILKRYLKLIFKEMNVGIRLRNATNKIE